MYCYKYYYDSLPWMEVYYITKLEYQSKLEILIDTKYFLIQIYISSVEYLEKYKKELELITEICRSC